MGASYRKEKLKVVADWAVLQTVVSGRGFLAKNVGGIGFLMAEDIGVLCGWELEPD